MGQSLGKQRSLPSLTLATYLLQDNHVNFTLDRINGLNSIRVFFPTTPLDVEKDLMFLLRNSRPFAGVSTTDDMANKTVFDIQPTKMRLNETYVFLYVSLARFLLTGLLPFLLLAVLNQRIRRLWTKPTCFMLIKPLKLTHKRFNSMIKLCPKEAR